MNFQIEYKDGRWLVDGKRWEDLNMDERNHLDNFFREYKTFNTESNDKEE